MAHIDVYVSIISAVSCLQAVSTVFYINNLADMSVHLHLHHRRRHCLRQKETNPVTKAN